jgi:AraC-like DNA-binding protein
MNSYARMERILRWLDTQATSQPTLAEMAAVAGLGESHFHHEFFRWTGVTPKDFVQGLTLNINHSGVIYLKWAYAGQSHPVFIRKWGYWHVKNNRSTF